MSLTGDQLIQVGWMIVSLAGLAIVCYTVLGVAAFKRTQKGAGKTFSLLMQRATPLKIATVLVIVISSSFLAVLKVIGEAGIIAILSSIAGFVLGGVLKGNEDKPDEPSDPE